jgi:hypothetical protein
LGTVPTTNTCKRCGASAYTFADSSGGQREERIPLCARCYARDKGIPLDENDAPPDDRVPEDSVPDDDDADAP